MKFIIDLFVFQIVSDVFKSAIELLERNWKYHILVA